VDVSGTKSASNPNAAGTTVTFPQISKNGSYTIKVTATNPAGTKSSVKSTTLTGPYTNYVIHNGGTEYDTSYIWSQPASGSGEVEAIKDANGQTVQVRCQKMGQQYNHPNGKAAFSGKLYDYLSHNGHVGYMIGYLPDTPHSPWQELAGPTIWEC
jgi:hypothetical protein